MKARGWEKTCDCAEGGERGGREGKQKKKTKRSDRAGGGKCKRLEEEEVEGSVATLDVQCPPLSAELLKNVLSVPSRKTKPRGDVHSRRQQQLQVAHMLCFGFFPAAQLTSGN